MPLTRLGAIAVACALLAAPASAAEGPPARVWSDVACVPSGPPRAGLLYLRPSGFSIDVYPEFLLALCRPFAKAGFDTIGVDYPIYLNPDAESFDYGRTFAHVRAATRRLEARGHTKVYAYGESVGGNLAAMLAVRRLVDAAVVVAAPTDLLAWGNDRPDLWAALGMTRAERAAGSPLRRLGRVHAPMLVMHSPRDDVVPFAQSRRFVARAGRARLVRLRGRHLRDTRATWIGTRWLGAQAAEAGATGPSTRRR